MTFIKWWLSRRIKKWKLTSIHSNGTTVSENPTGKYKSNISGFKSCSLTWFIENRGLHIETDYKVQNTVEKLLSEKDSAIDNRNQYDRNKDAEQMAKVRKDVESLRESGASQDAILATVIGR